ncbi:MAG: FtsX-like permease family protein [Bacteroidota bacterium]
MGFPFYIAKRYLVSKKSTNVINLISMITIVGVAIGTMALVVILSVFNGLESFVVSRFNSFDPDLKITVKQGKTFDASDEIFGKIKKLNSIDFYSEVIEENALVKYEDRYHPFTMKGVGHDYEKMTGIDSMMLDGTFTLHTGENPVAVIGSGVAGFLSVQLNFVNPLKIHMPRRTGKVKNISADPSKAFKVRNIYPAGVFSIDQDVDEYIIVPIDFARDLLDYTTEVSAIELKLKPGENPDKVKKAITAILGQDFAVKDRYEQKEFMYRIMESEKLIIFLILTFILIIASFNIIGSLTMLILDKKSDINTLRSLGANIRSIRRIFLLEGWMISVVGAVFGLLLGALLCWLQVEFEMIKLQGDADRLFITAYPVEMQWLDFIMVFVTVVCIGFAASWYPVRYITRKYLLIR